VSENLAQPLRRANRRQPPRSRYLLRPYPAASCRSRRRSAIVMNSPSPKSSVVRYLIWGAGCMLAIVTVLVLAFGFLRWDASRKRASWGHTAIAQLDNPITNAPSRAEIPIHEPGGWITDSILRMTNGQTLQYRFRHGSELLVPHLFLARDSDGQWWYSSFHFCNGMSMIRGEDPPGSVSEFARRFWLRQFKPFTDDWTESTWPP
jgi:hypothetical protein